MGLVFGTPRSVEQRGSLSQLVEAISPAHNRGGSGVVTADSALRHAAVWSCVDLICRLAALPLDTYRKVDGHAVEIAPPQLLAGKPDGTMHLIGWIRQILMSWLLRGNVFGAVAARDRLLWPTQVEILHPDRMTARRAGGLNGPVEWLVDGKPLGDDLVHWPAFTTPGTQIGLSPISYAASLVGLGLHAQQFGLDWFADGAHPDGILSSDQMIDADQARAMKERFMAAVRGSREPAVLGKGVRYEAIQIAANESQFLDTIRANKADVAGFFLVPPEMIGGESGSSMTYANIEQRGLSFITWNGGWWITMVEKFLSSLLPRGQYVKLQPAALAKVDAMTQARIQDTRIRGGWGTPDEARDLEDKLPLPGGVGARTLWPPYSTAPTEGPSDGPR